MVKTLEELIAEIEHMMNGQGTPFDIGCKLENAEQIYEKWQPLKPEKGICIISHWEWWDIQTSQDQNPETKPMPSVIYSDMVLFDSKGRFDLGSSARTTRILSLHDNCLVETLNTLYLLIGPGQRKAISAEAFTSLHFNI